MVVTNNDEIADRLDSLRDLAHSKKKRYLHYEIGFNYRMTNLQAAIGLAQMEKILEYIAARRNNANLYNSLLKDLTGLTLPSETGWAKNIYWLYSILVEDDFGVARDQLIGVLEEKGYPLRIPVSKRSREVV